MLQHTAVQSAELQGDRLFIETKGRGKKTLVFLPGLGGTTRYWAPRVTPLENGFHLVLVDLLGFGQSPKPWKKYTVEEHISALHRSLEPFAPFTLVGHSLGAVLALAYATAHPAEVKSMVLMGMPFFSSRRDAYRHYRQGPVRGGWLLTNTVLAMTACILTRRVFGKLLPYLLRDVPREVAQDLVLHTWRSSTSSLWEVIYRHDQWADMEQLPPAMGVLCIHGDQDVMAPLPAIEHCALNRANWGVAVLPGVDHHPFLRETGKCLDLIRAAAIQSMGFRSGSFDQ